MLILEHSQGFRCYSSYIGTEEARVWLYTYLSAVVEMWRCMLRRCYAFFYPLLALYWQSEARVNGEGCRNLLLTVFCTIPRQRAVHGRRRAIHWSSQWAWSTSSLNLLLSYPCFPQFPHFVFS